MEVEWKKKFVYISKYKMLKNLAYLIYGVKSGIIVTIQAIVHERDFWSVISVLLLDRSAGCMGEFNS